MALLHVERAWPRWIGAICLTTALMWSVPTPARALVIKGTVDVQPFVVGDARDNICSDSDFFLPTCGPGLITFSLHLNRPLTFQYSFQWTSGPPDNIPVFGNSEFLSGIEQQLGKPEDLKYHFSNTWDGTNLGIDLNIDASFFPQDQNLIVGQIMQFNTAPGSSGEWLQAAIDGREAAFFADFTTISADLTVVPEPPPWLMILTAFGAFFGIARRRFAMGRSAKPVK